MIKKAILLFLVFFGCYSLFVQFLAPKWWHAIQYTQQKNTIKAQSFMYDRNVPCVNVILGSSLSNRIVSSTMYDTYNLSFGGGSIYNGFKLLENTAVLPRNIFIEMNEVFRNEDQSFTSSLFSPVMYYPKKAIISLRDDRQPIGILGRRILSGIYAVKNRMRAGGKQVRVPALRLDSTEGNDTLSQTKFGLQINLYNQVPAIKDVNFSINILKTYVDEFQKKGVHVYFFEMPIDTRLENLPLAKLVRQSFYSNFPNSKYSYISMPDWKYCGTFDGIHLNNAYAIKYTAFLKDQVSALQK